MRDAILAWTSSFSDSRYMDYNHENRDDDYRGGTFEMQWNFSQALPSGSIGGRFLLLPVGIGHSGQGTLFVFHPGGHAAADMPLRFVYL